MTHDGRRPGEDDLGRLLRAEASRTLDPDLLLDRVRDGVERRRRTRQAVSLGATALAVTGMVVGAQALLPGPAPRPQDGQVAAGPPAVVCETVGGPGHLEHLLDTFFTTGYDFEDADALGALWNVDTYEAKVLAGQRLDDGVALPLAPGERPAAPSAPPAPLTDQARDALRDSGADEADVEQLSALWQSDDTALVAAVSGLRVLDGDAPPCTS